MFDFRSEVNFLKPDIQIDFNEVCDESNCYQSLLSQLEQRYKIKKTNIELFNGFSSSIYSLLKYLNSKFCYIYSPCNLEYKEASNNLGYETRLINRFENIYLPIKDESVVVFMNPSFLDGTFYELDKLFEYWASKNAKVIIDETLIDFCGKTSCIKYLEEYENLFIVKDLSKFYARKNLNIATVFASQKSIESLRKYEPENKISSFEIKYLEEALKDKKFATISNSIYIKNRIELEKILQEHKFVDSMFQSNSNSLLIRLKNIDSNEFKKKLSKNGVIINTCLEYDFIDEYFVSFYVGSLNNIKGLKKALNAF
ncbi:aminotransferase class I/II-fold pyridoxal phosphate-dependent enzyme [Halarcobacter sp.]|uniref:aminotransferase class I/II-fold pyridoxal phosphate-dependent enzyme n=1 Tax=Halarcobacter sp. TaxID=2321133 RepID=UPI003B007AE0